MDYHIYLETGINLLSNLTDFVILGVCIYYVVKVKSVDGILLLISSIMSVLTRPLFYLVYNHLLPGENYGSTWYLLIETIPKFFGIISLIIFSIGLFLIILKQIKYRTMKDEVTL